MTPSETDVSELLADTALGIQTKHAPVEAIVAGGRRRRNRRRATGAAAVALAAACTGGILTSALPDEGSGTASVAAAPHALPRPRTAVIATGVVDGKPWTVSIDVWQRAADTNEAARQWKAMEKAEFPDPQRAGGPEGPQLLHAGWFFANLKVGMRRSFVDDGALPEAGNGKVETSWGKFNSGPNWFALGVAAPGVHSITCTWDDGRKATPQLRTVAGTDSQFFAIEAPAPQPNAGLPRCTAGD
ncbi:hypothetical protein [Streptomyces sp. NPDC001054]